MKRSRWIVPTVVVIVGFVGIFLFLSQMNSFRHSEQVRSSLYINSAFSFSPKGDRIVFTDDGEGGSDLFLLNLKSERIIRVAKTPDYEGEPSFSPDDKWIVYVAGVPGDDADHIFIRSLDGSQMRQLTKEHQNDKAPSFSPDGSQIVFARNHRVMGGFQAPTWWGHCALYTINVDGTQLRKLTDLYDGEIEHPQFTPDGKSIVFMVRPYIYILRLDKRQASQPPVKLAHYPDLDYASLSPDGKRIVTSSDDGSLRIINIKGTASREVVKGTIEDIGYAIKPAFSPDGKHIVFLARIGGNRHGSTLWQMDLDGKNLFGLADEVLFSDPVAWRDYATE